MGILKFWDPFINYVITTLKELILNIKIDRALEYIIIYTLGDDCPTFTQKSKYFVIWTKNVNF
jgi:hypothetical protein